MSTQTLTPPSSLSLVPSNAPFNEEQRAWLNGFFAGMLGAQGASVGGITPVASDAASASVASEPVEEEMPWHDATVSMDERMKMTQGKRYPLKLMAAMAQLDCGSCGYVCKTYAEAIAKGEEK